METKKLATDNNRYLIREAIRKIALGRSMERINMAPSSMSGMGTPRMIHGYVAKIHDDPSDEEFGEYGGYVDVGESPNETASSEPVVHKGVLLAAAASNEDGFLLVPTLLSDVTIFMDAATRHAYVVNFSHVDLLQLSTHKETSIGVRETEEFDTESDSSPDDDELETTGTKPSSTRGYEYHGQEQGRQGSLRCDGCGKHHTDRGRTSLKAHRRLTRFDTR